MSLALCWTSYGCILKKFFGQVLQVLEVELVWTTAQLDGDALRHNSLLPETMKGRMMSEGRNGYYLKDTGCITAWHGYPASTLQVGLLADGWVVCSVNYHVEREWMLCGVGVQRLQWSTSSYCPAPFPSPCCRWRCFHLLKVWRLSDVSDAHSQKRLWTFDAVQYARCSWFDWVVDIATTVLGCLSW